MINGTKLEDSFEKQFTDSEHETFTKITMALFIESTNAQRLIAQLSPEEKIRFDQYVEAREAKQEFDEEDSAKTITYGYSRQSVKLSSSDEQNDTEKSATYTHKRKGCTLF